MSIARSMMVRGRPAGAYADDSSLDECEKDKSGTQNASSRGMDHPVKVADRQDVGCAWQEWSLIAAIATAGIAGVVTVYFLVYWSAWIH